MGVRGIDPDRQAIFVGVAIGVGVEGAAHRIHRRRVVAAFQGQRRTQQVERQVVR